MAGDRSWMDLDRGSTEWQTGMKEFLDFAFDGVPENYTVPCPCRRCVNITHKTRKDVHLDLLKNGMDPSYTCWIYHGEEHDEESLPKEPANEEVRGDDSAVHDMLSTLIRGTDVGNNTPSEKDVNANSGESSGDGGHGTNNQEPNQCAKAFFNLLKDAEKELYPGCKEATKLSFIVRLYQIKCLCGLTNKACDLVLQLFSSVLPKGHCIPDSLAKVQKIIRDLGLDYQKIHACINDCVLFRKEYASLDACPVCGESRWKTTASNDPHQATPSRRAKKPLPRKVLRNLYAMPDEANEDLMEADADILDVGVGKMTSPNIDDDISSWCRSGVEGASGDASEIQHIQPVDDPEDDQLESDDDVDDDDTYMNDGHVAPLLEEPDDDHGFFV